MPARHYLANLSRGGVHGSFFLKSKEETLFIFPCSPSDLVGSEDDHLAASTCKNLHIGSKRVCMML